MMKVIAVAILGCVAACAALLIAVNLTLSGSGVPTCTWPLAVRGKATPAQIDLVRCYVEDLAHRDTAGLTTLMFPSSYTAITSADLAYSKDARLAPAIATFTPIPVATNTLTLTITYPNRVTESSAMDELLGGGWRMDIGTTTGGPKGPPPLKAG
jgi:hypothetical protein